jgi:hypothetical protein
VAQIIGVRSSAFYYIKTLLPNYREFDEPRHFTSSMEIYGEEQDGIGLNYFVPE